MRWRDRVRQAALAAGLALLLPFSDTPAPAHPVVLSRPHAPPDTAANAKLRNLEGRLLHLPQVRSTLRCEAPGARAAIVHLKQVHHSADSLGLLRTVIEGGDLELRQHATAVLQDQYLHLSMVQEDLYGIIGFLHEAGMREITIEGMPSDQPWQTAAREYAELLGEVRELGLFSPDPTGLGGFPRDPLQAERASRLTEISYLAAFATGLPPTDDPRELALRKRLQLLAGPPPQDADLDLVRYALGADLLAAADYRLAIRPFEDEAYTARVMIDRVLSRSGGIAPDWSRITDGREDRFLEMVRARAPDGELVVTTLGAAHAFGGTESCPDADPAAFDDRLSYADNLAVWNRTSGYPVSVLEVEPTMQRDVVEQIMYNNTVAAWLLKELHDRRAAARGP